MTVDFHDLSAAMRATYEMFDHAIVVGRDDKLMLELTEGNSTPQSAINNLDPFHSVWVTGRFGVCVIVADCPTSETLVRIFAYNTTRALWRPKTNAPKCPSKIHVLASLWESATSCAEVQMEFNDWEVTDAR